MKTLLLLLSLSALYAQKHELGLTMGRVIGQDRSISGTSVKLDSGLALQANYGVRLAGNEAVAVYGAVNFLASPLRDVTSANRASIRDFATIYPTFPF